MLSSASASHNAGVLGVAGLTEKVAAGPWSLLVLGKKDSPVGVDDLLGGDGGDRGRGGSRLASAASHLPF